MIHNDHIEKAIRYFSKLPGFGPRSAKRVVLYFLKNKDTVINGFIDILKILEEKTTECQICHNITTEETCEICINSKRDNKVLCVVEEVDDLWNFEKSSVFNGLYHCLGGSLSAIEGITPEKLNIQSLRERLERGNFEEIIFANNLSVQGATTTFYIMEEIREMQQEGKLATDLKITELANGIPIGSSLEYIDEGTIKASFNLRRSIAI
jgi:recombination protein RecR